MSERERVTERKSESVCVCLREIWRERKREREYLCESIFVRVNTFCGSCH